MIKNILGTILIFLSYYGSLYLLQFFGIVSTSLAFQYAVYATLVAIVVSIIAYALRNKIDTSRARFRKVTHIASGLAVLMLVYFLGRLEAAAFLLAIGAAFITHEVLFSKGISTIFTWPLLFIGRASRDNKQRPVFMPTIWSIISLGIIILIFPVNIAEISIAAFTFGDGLAFLVGRKWGHHKLPHNNEKSWEGTFAFMIGGTFGIWYFAPFLIALFVSIFAAGVES
ncbi:MAG: hypothetical protein QXL15_01425, partial [Candidatus Korarchaeota archaeon]